MSSKVEKLREAGLHSSSMETITQLQERGFRTDFKFSKGKLLCLGTEKTYTPQDLSMIGSFRFEGKSDPDDMSIVYAFRAKDGTQGQFMDAFGVNADHKIADFWAQVPDGREGSGLMEGVPSTKTIVISSQSEPAPSTPATEKPR